MQRHHTGSGRRTVFSAEWQAHGAAVITDTMDCTVQVGVSGGAPAWNPTTKQTETPVVAAVYDGPATITPVSDTSTRVDVVAETVETQDYLVKLPVAVAGLKTSHVVKVSASPDAMLTGRTMQIDSIERAGRRFSRVIRATLNG